MEWLFLVWIRVCSEFELFRVKRSPVHSDFVRDSAEWRYRLAELQCRQEEWRCQLEA